MDSPTVLVKKSDGTSVRMTLAEVQAMQQKSTPTKAAPVAVPPAPVAPAKPNVAPASPVSARSEKSALVPQSAPPTPRPAPVARPVVTPVATPAKTTPPVKVANEDFGSLLEESLPSTNALASRTSAQRTDTADRIIAELGFQVPADLTNRLRSLIQLRLKDVRTESQTILAAERSVAAGGLGFTPEQSARVAALCQSYIVPDVSHVAVPTIKDLKSTTPNNLPEVAPVAGLPTTQTPYNSFRHSASALPVSSAPQKTAFNTRSFQPQKDIAPRVMPNPTKSIPLPTEPAPFKLSSTTPSKKMPMVDIVSRPVAMGPVDEIAAFTLTDFRRLAPTPEEAAARLKQKFVNLRDESIVLFLEALDAWRRSPLHGAYTALMTQALMTGKQFSALTTDKAQLQVAEINAIIEMEKQLSV